MTEKLEVTLNLTDIVRAEVKAALKAMLAQGMEEDSKVHKSGDYETGIVKPKEAKKNDGDGDGDDGHDGKPPMKLPVKVVKPDGAVQYRRKKRTQGEMNAAISKALPIVSAKHPDWSERRLKRLAKNLVRRYKVNP